VNERELMAADLQDIFLAEGGPGESATYNGTTIMVLPEIGQTLQSGNNVNSEGSSDRAVFGVAVTDVSLPAANDKIVHSGKTWTVARILSTDSAMHRVECSANFSPYRRG